MINRLLVQKLLFYLGKASPKAAKNHKYRVKRQEHKGRVEPRTRKRRPKSFPLMNQPRSVLKEQLAA